jgi:hypothetical protein
MSTQKSNSGILSELFVGCRDFSAYALASITPELRARLIPARNFVAIGTKPPCARLLVEGKDDALAVVFEARGKDFPKSLGVATAQLLEAGLATLSEDMRARLSVLQESGRGLGVVVDRDLGSAHIMIDGGGSWPLVVATLVFESGAAH